MSLLSEEKIEELRSTLHIAISASDFRAIEAAVLEAQKQEPFPFSAERVTYHKAGAIGAIMPCGTMVTNVKEAYEAGRKSVLEAQAGQEEVGYVGEYVLPTKNLKAGTPLYAAPVVQPGVVKLQEHVAQCMKGSAKLVEQAFNDATNVGLQVALGDKLQWWMRTAELIAAAEGKK